MTDTPDHVKKIQLEIWLAKSPAERLRQFLIDNETLVGFWKDAHKAWVKENKSAQETDQPG
ncbi:MAG TPA: hypothetical protein VEY06_10985 [Flavisolibacter sp.]|jgi:hypothetical protein|nr:hypothetical protein [Flavisolibacter sp.]